MNYSFIHVSFRLMVSFIYKTQKQKKEFLIKEVPLKNYETDYFGVFGLSPFSSIYNLERHTNFPQLVL